MALTPEDIETFHNAVAQLSQDPKADAEPTGDVAALITLLEDRRQVVVSTNPAINDILIARPGPHEGGYNDEGPGGYSQFIEDDDDSAGYSDAGYNDYQEPRPGGGYGDYSQFLNQLDGHQSPRYNDGPQDLHSTQQLEVLAGPLVNIARDRNLLSELRSVVIEIEKGGR